MKGFNSTQESSWKGFNLRLQTALVLWPSLHDCRPLTACDIRFGCYLNDFQESMSTPQWGIHTKHDTQNSWIFLSTKKTYFAAVMLFKLSRSFLILIIELLIKRAGTVLQRESLSFPKSCNVHQSKKKLRSEKFKSEKVLALQRVYMNEFIYWGVSACCSFSQDCFSKFCSNI